MNIYGQPQEEEEKILHTEEKSDRLTVKDGKLLCPACGRGVLQYDAGPGMVMLNVPRKCKRCGKTTIVNIDLRLRL